MKKLILISLLIIPGLLYAQRNGYQTPSLDAPFPLDSAFIAYINRDNNFSGTQTFDNIIATGKASIDTTETGLVQSTGGLFVLSASTNNAFFGRSDFSSLITVAGSLSSNNISFTNNNIATLRISPTAITGLVPNVIVNMSQAQRDLLTPERFMVIGNNDTNELNFWNGSEWREIQSITAP